MDLAARSFFKFLESLCRLHIYCHFRIRIVNLITLFLERNQEEGVPRGTVNLQFYYNDFINSCQHLFSFIFILSQKEILHSYAFS